MQSSQLRQKFLDFFKKNGHTVVPSSSLLPTDPSVLFTTAGMQQFKPYYLGEKSPYGENAVSVQKCIRTSDIDEVGDERHLTFFEMLGNFSFGGYWKKRAIELAYKFIVEELKLDIDYVTVFKGDDNVPADIESEEIWKAIDKNIKIKKEGRDNFWGPTGSGGPCGPTTEIYVNGIEIWNLVFNEFFCDGSRDQLDKGHAKLTPLEAKGIDTGMGLERLAAVMQNVPTVFDTDGFTPLIVEDLKKADTRLQRIIVDHFKASIFLVADGVLPSNKDQGYILRRLIRRAATYARIAKLAPETPQQIIDGIIDMYAATYPELKEKHSHITQVMSEESQKFCLTMDKGLKELEKIDSVDAKQAFLLYQSFGLPFDIIKEMAPEKTKQLSHEDFEAELKKHQELSRTASAGMFKGGLADHSPETVKLHTAHHLLLAALQQVFGKQVKQRGSNINAERLRIDFSLDHKMTDEEKKQVENIVNEKIQEGLEVVKREMPKEEAEKLGAEMEFGVKYGDRVSVYFIEDKNGVFSKEFCGGPHVTNTRELGKFKIIKEEAVSSGVRRIKATLE